MAYMSQEMKKELAPKVKEICKKYNMKATLSVRHHSTLVLNVKSGPIDFDLQLNNYEQVNVYHIDKHHNGTARKFLEEVNDAMNIGNHDNSDAMVDYFDVGWYTDINIGKWNKPYILTKG